MIADFILWSGIGLVLYAFYKWATINNDYFEKRGVNYVKPTFLVGSGGGFIFLRKYTLNEFVDQMYSSKPDSK